MTKAWLQKAVEQYQNDNFKDGDLISLDWVRWALDIPPQHHFENPQDQQIMLMTRFGAFKDYMLTEKKVALQNIRGKGYRIVPPNEQAQYAAEEAMSQVKKGLDKGDKLLSNTRMDEMSATDASRHTNVQVKLLGLRQFMDRQKKDVFLPFAAGNVKENILAS